MHIALSVSNQCDFTEVLISGDVWLYIDVFEIARSLGLCSDCPGFVLYYICFIITHWADHNRIFFTIP